MYEQEIIKKLNSNIHQLFKIGFSGGFFVFPIPVLKNENEISIDQLKTFKNNLIDFLITKNIEIEYFKIPKITQKTIRELLNDTNYLAVQKRRFEFSNNAIVKSKYYGLVKIFNTKSHTTDIIELIYLLEELIVALISLLN